MYKKFMLCLLLLPLFSSSESIASGMEPVVIAAIIGVCYDVVKNGYIAGCEWLKPSDAAQAFATQALLQKNYLAAKSDFIKCLEGTTPESKRNEENVPTDCEKTAMAFIICGGVDEVFNMTRSFKPKK